MIEGAVLCTRCTRPAKPTGKRITYFETSDLVEYRCPLCGQIVWNPEAKIKEEDENERKENDKI